MKKVPIRGFFSLLRKDRIQKLPIHKPFVKGLVERSESHVTMEQHRSGGGITVNGHVEPLAVGMDMDASVRDIWDLKSVNFLVIRAFETAKSTP